MIIINEIDNDKFVVYVKSDEESKHTVIFEDKYYLRFNKNKSKREIIKESFKFRINEHFNILIKYVADYLGINIYFFGEKVKMFKFLLYLQLHL